MTRRLLDVILFLFLLTRAPPSLDAHEVRPGYLELRQRSAEIYDVLWKVPARGDLRLRLEVRFPEQCSITDPSVQMQSGNAILERWSVRCPQGLEGHSISIDGGRFAGALSEIGLPQQDIPIALLMFNVGVELGQLSFVFVVLGLWKFVCRFPVHGPDWIEKLPAYGIGIVAAYWTIDRVFGFLA